MMKRQKSNSVNKRLIGWLNKHKRFVIPVIVLFIIGGYMSFSRLNNTPPTETKISAEIQQILATKDLKTQVRLYKALIERVGPEQAQDDLVRSGLPFTGETHLLNHTVGDYIYEKYGISGITMCRNYFLESCYHGLLLNVIGGDADKDLEDIRTIMNHCEKAGPTVAVQCAHGIGHGYVAAVGYANLDRGLAQCVQLGDTIENFPVFNCLDGGFMENIWAVHGGEPSPDRWVKETDDFYPCNDARLQQSSYSAACWSNQPSLLYQRYDEDISKVGDICLTVTPDNLRETCFNGLSRQIHPVTENQIDRVYALCAEMPDEWVNYCHITIANAAFSVGDRKLPYEMCTRARGDEKTACYDNLIGSIRANTQSSDEIKHLCALIPETDQAPRVQCLESN